MFGDISKIKNQIIMSIKNLDLVDEVVGLDDEGRGERRGLLISMNFC